MGAWPQWWPALNDDERRILRADGVSLERKGQARQLLKEQETQTLALLSKGRVAELRRF